MLQSIFSFQNFSHHHTFNRVIQTTMQSSYKRVRISTNAKEMFDVSAFGIFQNIPSARNTCFKKSTSTINYHRHV